MRHVEPAGGVPICAEVPNWKLDHGMRISTE
jgi:hypothetical protein